jgi:uncharacterized protein YodC (DUF2158 family)
MEQHQFAVGETVKLNSGGEVMTVEAVGTDAISCVWFNGKKVERSSFLPATLHKHEDSFSIF